MVSARGLLFLRQNNTLLQDIQVFLDEAEEGVMLLALGFLFDPGQVPRERMDSLMEALGRLPQRVIARFPVSQVSHRENLGSL